MRTKWKILISLGFLSLVVFATFFIVSTNDIKLSSSPDVARGETNIILTEEKITNNIAAFAKLYGYIRFFHPSDEVEELDWDAFAVYGVQQVKEAKTTEELKTTLEKLFKPIAPTFTLTTEDDYQEDSSEIARLLADSNGEDFILWQHFGVQTRGTDSFYGQNRFYESKRVQFSTEDEQVVLDDALFQEYLNEEDYILETEITDDVTGFIPIVLPYKDGSIGSTKDTKEGFINLQKKINESMKKGVDISNEDVRFSGIVLTWNIYQHFYPYFDVVDVNWEEQLTATIERVKKTESYEEYVTALTTMIEKAEDGHSVVISNLDGKNSLSLPFRIQLIEEEIVITDVQSNSPFQVGDIILTKNGKEAKELLSNLIEETSGSPQFKESNGEFKFVLGYYNENASFEILRDGEQLEVNTSHKRSISNKTDIPWKKTEPIKELKEGVYYIDLGQEVTPLELERYLDEFATAKGLIFDGRNYPSGMALQYLEHLTDKPISTSKFLVPQHILPDQEKVTFYDASWEIEPKTPQFQGEIVFLSEGHTVSYGETILGLVENHELGTIIGKPTAGANGNVNVIELTDDISIYFTGMKVLKGDESQHHLIGIQPDIYVDYMLEAVKSGEDDFIEKALEVIEKKSNN